MLALVAIVACADFLTGKEGRKYIQKHLEDWWLYLQYVRFRTVGIEEITFTLTLFDKIFGRRFFSTKRFISCLIYYIAAISLFYVLVESYRYRHGMLWRPPFSDPHYATGFPAHIFSIMFSITLTRFILYKSKAMVRYGSFGIFMTILALLISSGFPFSLSIITQPLVLRIEDLLEAILSALFRENYRAIVAPILLTAHFWYVQVLYIRNVYLGVYEFFFGYFTGTPSNTTMTFTVSPFWHAFRTASLIDDSLIEYYRSFVDLSVQSIRLFFAAVFLFCWSAARPLHWLTSLLIYRFAEAEKGPLTIFAAALAALAKLIQQLSKGT